MKALAPHVRLGPYEIRSLLGAGGMGEVYKANDTRLDRVVAIKVLRGHMAADPLLRDRPNRGRHCRCSPRLLAIREAR